MMWYIRLFFIRVTAMKSIQFKSLGGFTSSQRKKLADALSPPQSTELKPAAYKTEKDGASCEQDFWAENGRKCVASSSATA